MWEEVAECSSAVGRGGRVREVVRERMERGEATPTLLCVLGDVMRDPGDYRRAWEMSGGRCGRAQRSLGFYHLRRQEVSPLPVYSLLSLTHARMHACTHTHTFSQTHTHLTHLHTFLFLSSTLSLSHALSFFFSPSLPPSLYPSFTILNSPSLCLPPPVLHTYSTRNVLRPLNFP